MHVPTPGVAPALAPVGDTGSGEILAKPRIGDLEYHPSTFEDSFGANIFLIFDRLISRFYTKFSVLYAGIPVGSLNCKFLT